jgi:hypothetical protein
MAKDSVKKVQAQVSENSENSLKNFSIQVQISVDQDSTGSPLVPSGSESHIYIKFSKYLSFFPEVWAIMCHTIEELYDRHVRPVINEELKKNNLEKYYKVIVHATDKNLIRKKGQLKIFVNSILNFSCQADYIDNKIINIKDLSISIESEKLSLFSDQGEIFTKIDIKFGDIKQNDDVKGDNKHIQNCPFEDLQNKINAANENPGTKVHIINSGVNKPDKKINIQPNENVPDILPQVE